MEKRELTSGLDQLASPPAQSLLSRLPKLPGAPAYDGVYLTDTYVLDTSNEGHVFACTQGLVAGAYYDTTADRNGVDLMVDAAIASTPDYLSTQIGVLDETGAFECWMTRDVSSTAVPFTHDFGMDRATGTVGRI